MQSLVAGRRAAVLLCACAVSAAQAKPIAFADGTTVMAEYGAGTMVEAQAFYAPSYRFSAGGGYLRLDSDLARRSREIEYVRANVLAKRWNLDAAQANVFVWGSLGRGRGDGFDGSRLARNAGFQLDYETRRVYAAVKSDLWESPAFSHRIDTVQLGLAPYEHDYRDLATWFVVQARRYTGEIHRGTETALLLRLFKGGTWVEAGVTDDGKPQVMAMFNF
ncbi:hypothetical protein [Dokdonella sp.]|uniref:hypothetical protein n=1 Tax=Dokdonella sp. TaxID=2291710 RepID=UPI001B14D2CC|nr:hypothetical protein [Dokdonella sp.]MBO9664073.1 hypothetical protein [Dokdonella sp.]